MSIRCRMGFHKPSGLYQTAVGGREVMLCSRCPAVLDERSLDVARITRGLSRASLPPGRPTDSYRRQNDDDEDRRRRHDEQRGSDALLMASLVSSNPDYSDPSPHQDSFSGHGAHFSEGGASDSFDGGSADSGGSGSSD